MTNEEVSEMAHGTKVRFLGFLDQFSSEIINLPIGSEITRERCGNDGPSGESGPPLFGFRHGTEQFAYDFFFADEVELV